MRNHCIFIKTDLRYDGRVCAIIKTLSKSFPSDHIYIYALIDKDVDINLPKNVKYCRCKSLLNHFPKQHVINALRAVEFAVYSFFKLLFLKPYTVQVHHDVVIPGPLLYKLLRKQCFYVYDDKELYIPRNKNTTRYLFCFEKIFIKKVDFVIYTNRYRKKAIYHLFKPKNKHIIVENFVFESSKDILSKSLVSLLDSVKDKKILLHQGILSKNRGFDNILTIVQCLPRDWVMGFIGISDENFEELSRVAGSRYQHCMKNFGFIPYIQLNAFWEKYIDASILFYDDKTFNNKYAAPNRLYAAANNGIPIIVNAENVTLKTFVEAYTSGIYFPPKSNIDVFFRDFEYYKGKAKLLANKFEYSNGLIPQLLHIYKTLS
jgi:hypothetical protein